MFLTTLFQLSGVFKRNVIKYIEIKEGYNFFTPAHVERAAVHRLHTTRQTARIGVHFGEIAAYFSLLSIFLHIVILKKEDLKRNLFLNFFKVHF